jgi:hypothetical protein
MIQVITIGPGVTHAALVREIVTSLHRQGGVIVHVERRAGPIDRAFRAIRKAIFRRFNTMGALTDWTIGERPGGLAMVLRSHPPGPVNWYRNR